MYLHAEIKPSPGIPDGPLLRSVVGGLLEPVLDQLTLIESGDKLQPSTAIETIAAEIERKVPYPLDVRGKGTLFASVSLRNTANPITGSITVGFDSTKVDPDRLRQPFITAAVALAAPWATIGPPERARSHVQLYQEGAADGERWFDLHRGLTGIAPVTVVGACMVDFLGEDNLQSLPDDIARRVDGGAWVLTPGSFTDWQDDAWCDAERSVIEVLGPEKFFDPSSGRLPTSGPSLPDRGTFAGKVHPEPGSKEWIPLQTGP